MEWVNFFFPLIVSCIPAHLQKYQQKNDLTQPIGPGFGQAPQNNHLERDESDNLDVDGNAGRLDPNNSSKKQNSIQPEKYHPNLQSFFFQTGQNTYRVRFQESEVWETILDVLIRNYSLAIVDRNAGVLATDWDSFYIGKKVYRNKLSFRVKKNPQNGEKINGVEFVIHNNVERLGDLPQGSLGLGMVWLPASDPIDEVTRIVQNMALLLKIPPPPKLYDQSISTAKPNSSQDLR